MLRPNRNDYPKFVIPRGVAIWPAINKPDFKFKKEFGEFHCRVRLTPDADGGFDPAEKAPVSLQDIIAAAEAIRDEAFEAKKAQLIKEKKVALANKLVKADVIRPEVNQETDEETGFLVLRASTNAGGRRKKDNSVWKGRVDVFNARGEQLKNPPEIGSGSEVKLSVRVMDYETDGGKTIGARYELEGLQLLKAVSGGSRTASDYGFSEEDGDDINDGEANSHGFGDEDGGGENEDF